MDEGRGGSREEFSKRHFFGVRVYFDGIFEGGELGIGNGLGRCLVHIFAAGDRRRGNDDLGFCHRRGRVGGLSRPLNWRMNQGRKKNHSRCC